MPILVAYEEIPETLASDTPDDSPLDFEITGQYTGERGANEIVGDERLAPISPATHMDGIFQPVADYRRQDGSFDMEAAKEDYRKFLQSVPGKYRIYLEQSLDAVGYEQRELKTAPFGYSRAEDLFLYNPYHSDFYRYDFRMVATHELGHRIDNFFVRSWKQDDFTNTIQKAAAVIDEKPEIFIQYCQDNDTDGFLSDIMSGICKEKHLFPARHGKSYWEDKDKQAREIFTDLFALHTYEDESKLDFLKNHFPDLLRCFNGLEYYYEEVLACML